MIGIIVASITGEFCAFRKAMRELIPEAYMDTKDRIKQLMDQRQWTLYELARRSGLAQTTLANMWRRNNEPSIPSLRLICNAFGITLTQFFSEEDGRPVELNDEQRELLQHWSVLSSTQKILITQLMEEMR